MCILDCLETWHILVISVILFLVGAFMFANYKIVFKFFYFVENLFKSDQKKR